MAAPAIGRPLFSWKPAWLVIWLMFPAWACATDPPPPPPKREFRAVWVATFHNIDWPSAKGLSRQAIQTEWQELLQRQEANGMNALIVQVRPSGDALYPSRLAPWSEFLSGTQGKAPAGNFDPLAYMVQATHNANMEFHAWLNPFRAISHQRFSSVSPDNVALLRPEWTFQYGERIYLNPGLPEVRAYLVQVVMEVVKNYDVDGIHFDDYFYPYEEPGNPFRGDLTTFQRYGGGFSNIHDWRRHTLDQFIATLSDSIRAVKPWVKFGISPVGIWRNKQDDPRGSATSSSHTAYDVLHADVRFWLVKGWIDYVAPQLYWSTRHPLASYQELLPWWAANSFGKHVYVGHAAFKLVDNQEPKTWENPQQLPLQLELRRAMADRIHGGVFYSASSFDKNPFGIEDQLRGRFHRVPAMVPAMPWKDPLPPGIPGGPAARRNLSHVLVTWQAPPPAADGDTAVRYAVYRLPEKEVESTQSMEHFLGYTHSPLFIDHHPAKGKSYYLVTALDRLHNESAPARANLPDTFTTISQEDHIDERAWQRAAELTLWSREMPMK